MTCSLFVPVLLFVIHPSAAFGGRNAGDGVPYGDLCPDTPPGVSGSTRPNVGDTRGRRSLWGDPPNAGGGPDPSAPAVPDFWRGSRWDHGNAKVLVILLQKRFCRILGFR